MVSSVSHTLKITVMMFMIMTGAMAFSQILAFCGASSGLVQLAGTLDLPPMFILIFMQIILLFMGVFMEPLTIMMVTLPIYMPIVKSLGFNPLWFGTIMLINMEMATTTPPFGLVLFAVECLFCRGFGVVANAFRCSSSRRRKLSNSAYSGSTVASRSI